MKLVKCFDEKGGIKDFPAEKLEFRPSAYALVINEGKVLLSYFRDTGKYILPGGAIDPGETYQEALLREMEEENGVKIEIGELAFWEERFFYYTTEDRAWQVYGLVFWSKPLTLEITKNDEPVDLAEQTAWIEISTLKPEQFQLWGEQIIEALSKISY